ncbi:E3 ubiquitin-protein ligase bre1, partial [Teratosphaeriaceae sp. CCFEE 6253]
IVALETETERLRLRLGEETPPQDSNLDELDSETLRTKLRTLEAQHSALCNELASMEAAWKKASALAATKVTDVAAQEELVSRLQAEKAKADQKYFAAMKSKDMKEGELRSLRAQNSRSSEIVTQLKDTEGKTRELVTNLERQVAESREMLTKLETQHRALDSKAKEALISSEGLKKSVEAMKVLVAEKDKANLAASKAKRDVEAEVERCQVRLEDSRKQIEVLRSTRAPRTRPARMIGGYVILRRTRSYDELSADLTTHRNSSSARPATSTSATPSSSSAGTSSAESACSGSSRTGRASVRAAGRRLGIRIT